MYWLRLIWRKDTSEQTGRGLDLSIHTVGPMLSVRKYLKDEQENARERVDSKLCKFTTGG